MEKSLIGHRVIVGISDPWDFVTDNDGTRTGTILTEQSPVTALPILLIKFDNKLEESGIFTDTVFASFRHIGVDKQQLLSGQIVPCNFSTKMDGDNSSAAVGAIAFIGGLKLLGHSA